MIQAHSETPRRSSSDTRHAEGPDARPARSLLAGPPLVSDVLVGGFLAYMAVVVTVAAMDLARGFPLFHTPAVVGDWLFFEGAHAGALAAGPILVYNGFHLLASLLAAAVGGVVTRQAERTPGVWYLGLMLVLAGVTMALALMGGIGVEARHLVDWWTVGAGTAAWFGALVAYFRWSHPQVVEAMADSLE